MLRIPYIPPIFTRANQIESGYSKYSWYEVLSKRKSIIISGFAVESFPFKG
jgi:hypothetical protein